MGLPGFLKDALLALRCTRPAELDAAGRQELFGSPEARAFGPYAGATLEMCRPLTPTTAQRLWWVPGGWEKDKVIPGPRPHYTVRAYFGDDCAFMCFDKRGTRLFL